MHQLGQIEKVRKLRGARGVQTRYKPSKEATELNSLTEGWLQENSF